MTVTVTSLIMTPKHDTLTCLWEERLMRKGMKKAWTIFNCGDMLSLLCAENASIESAHAFHDCVWFVICMDPPLEVHAKLQKTGWNVIKC